MRAIRYHEHGDTDVLTLEEIDRPTPGPDDILVENRAIGINHVDTIFREGIFTPPGLPAIPGSDFAGEVVEVGSNVTAYKVGDRVHGAGLGGDRDGTYAEYVSAPLDRVSQLPDAISYLEGAAMGHTGVAAWQAVVDHGNLEPGKTCLIHGGGGGVGHVAVQLAANNGATVITTEATQETRDRLEELGAHAAFDFRRDDLAEAVTAVGAPDLIVDYFFDLYTEFDISNIAHDGTITVLEYSTEEDGQTTIDQSILRAGILKDVTIQLVGIFNGDISTVLGRLSTLVERGDLAVEVADTYDLAEAQQAHRDIVDKEAPGRFLFEL